MTSQTHHRDQVVRRAHGKVNLGLQVLKRRSDGYHDISTVMAPIAWSDELIYTDAGPFRFTCSDPSLPTDGSNLCVQAAILLSTAAGVEPRGHLHLEKSLPAGAGLGGGSSDAATTLLTLAEAWDTAFRPDSMAELALELGSDVPFFLRRYPQIARGRGEILSRVRIHPRIAASQIVVVMPPVQVATAAAYARIRPGSTTRTDLVGVVQSGDWDSLRERAQNDFEEVLLESTPAIAHARDVLEKARANFVSMSGSGAAVYGLFDDANAAVTAVQKAADRGLRAHSSRFDEVWA